jgi:hypothetical protein
VLECRRVGLEEKGFEDFPPPWLFHLFPPLWSFVCYCLRVNCEYSVVVSQMEARFANPSSAGGLGSQQARSQASTGPVTNRTSGHESVNTWAFLGTNPKCEPINPPGIGWKRQGNFPDRDFLAARLYFSGLCVQWVISEHGTGYPSTIAELDPAAESLRGLALRTKHHFRYFAYHVSIRF